MTDKNNEWTIADLLPELGSPEELLVPKTLQQQIAATATEINFGHHTGVDGTKPPNNIIGDQVEEWESENAELVRQCNTTKGEEADNALIELVRRDKRYLGSKLVAAKAVLWWCQWRLAQLQRKESTERTAHKLHRGANAWRMLNRLGEAIPHIGRAQYRGQYQFLEIYYEGGDAVAQLARELDLVEQGGVHRGKILSISQICALEKECGVSRDAIKFLWLYPKKREECRRYIVGGWLQLAPSTLKGEFRKLRGLIREGLLDDPETEEFEPPNVS